MLNDLLINLIANVIWSILLSLFSQPIKLFSFKHLDKSIYAGSALNTKRPFFSFSLGTLSFYFLALTSGGLIWNVINKLFGWSFYMSGGLHGIYALFWCFTTVIPLIFFTIFGSFHSKRITNKIFLKLISISLIYSIFASVGAVIFYDLKFREFFESLQISYLLQEICIVIIWSILISTLSALSISLAISDSKQFLKPSVVYYQIPLSCIIALIGVVLSSVFSFEGTIQVQFRGLFAAVGFRAGLMIGLILASRDFAYFINK